LSERTASSGVAIQAYHTIARLRKREPDRSHFVAIANTLAEGNEGARRVVVPGVAHLPNMESPEEFMRLVLGFLEGGPAKS
jgi:pimeloyl-ACP methyl ester carboxylesterase